MKHPIIVFGHGPGISDAVARRFGKAGHPVAIVARNAQRLDQAAQALRASGIDAHPFTADLSDAAAVTATVGAVRTALGPVGTLHWNAFLDVDGDLLSVTPAELNQGYAIRVTGYITAIQACLSDLEANRGSVLATCGVMALDDPRIDAFATGYGALAIGVAAQHKANGILAQTLAPRGIHVGEVIVNGFVRGTPGGADKPGALEPNDIAEAFWNLHENRHAHSVIVGGAVATTREAPHA